MCERLFLMSDLQYRQEGMVKVRRGNSMVWFNVLGYLIELVGQ